MERRYCHIGLRGWPKPRKRANGNLGSRTQPSRWRGRGISFGLRFSVLCLFVLALSFVDLYICSHKNDLSLSSYPGPRMFNTYCVDGTGEVRFINCSNSDLLLKLLQRGGIELNPGPPPTQTRLNSAGEIELQSSASSDFEEIKKMLMDLTGKVNAVASDIKGIHDQLDGITSFQNQQTVINKNVSSEMESLNGRISKLENELHVDKPVRHCVTPPIEYDLVKLKPGDQLHSNNRSLGRSVSQFYKIFRAATVYFRCLGLLGFVY